MISISKEANKNYLAKIVQLEGLKKHPNADRLQTVDIDFQTVITGLTAQDGDIYVYFPVECKINEDFLSFTNSFRDAEKNIDKEKKGFFEDNARVRAMRLRGVPSNGYIVPIEDLESFTGKSGLVKYVGEEFDTIGNIKLLEKYVVKTKNPNPTKQGKKPTRVSKIIEGQFKFHGDTSNFRRTVDTFKDNDMISLSYKLHGTSVVLANLLVKKPLNWIERSLQWMGINIVNKKYDLIYSSRRVIKNEYLEDEKRHNHFYSSDVWGIAAKRYEDLIPKGFTIYGELVGQLPDGSWIQKNYDYGTSKGEFEMYVYRITFTNEDGQTFELSTLQVQELCNSLGLKVPKLYYTGTLKELKVELGVDSTEELIVALENKYNNKKCFMCKNSVWEEGIVIRKENIVGFEAAKLKSFNFLEFESKQLDSGEEDIENTN